MRRSRRLSGGEPEHSQPLFPSFDICRNKNPVDPNTGRPGDGRPWHSGQGPSLPSLDSDGGPGVRATSAMRRFRYSAAYIMSIRVYVTSTRVSARLLGIRKTPVTQESAGQGINSPPFPRLLPHFHLLLTFIILGYIYIFLQYISLQAYISLPCLIVMSSPSVTEDALLLSSDWSG